MGVENHLLSCYPIINLSEEYMNKKPMNKLAIASPLLFMVGLVIAVVFAYIEIHGVDTYFPVDSIIQLLAVFFFSLLAFFFGVIAVAQISKRKGEQGGLGLAILGMVVGILGMGAALVLFMLLSGVI